MLWISQSVTCLQSRRKLTPVNSVICLIPCLHLLQQGVWMIPSSRDTISGYCALLLRRQWLQNTIPPDTYMQGTHYYVSQYRQNKIAKGKPHTNQFLKWLCLVNWIVKKTADIVMTIITLIIIIKIVLTFTRATGLLRSYSILPDDPHTFFLVAGNLKVSGVSLWKHFFPTCDLHLFL